MPSPNPTTATDLEVVRADLRRTRVVERPVPEPAPGEALLRVERFGLSANNVTYAVIGDALGYWSFFPADEPWGRIPVWGFGEVVAGDALEHGTRVFGYLPMSTHLMVTPDRVDEGGFVDAAPHRAALPRAYNAYRRTDTDPGYDPEREDEQILLRPLFFLSFLLDDFLATHALFGAETVVLSSASSKTALGIAFLVAGRGVDVVALTSPRNVEFVEGVGVYERVVTYDDVGALGDRPAVFADMAGNADVRRAVHEHYGDALRHSALVGATHQEPGAQPDPGLPGPAPAFFFAPEQLRLRTREWGPAGVDERMGAAWRAFVDWCDGWLRIERGAGLDAVTRAYLAVVDGDVRPETGHVVTLLD
jgi:hypothetical protein